MTVPQDYRYLRRMEYIDTPNSNIDKCCYQYSFASSGNNYLRICKMEVNRHKIRDLMKPRRELQSFR